MLNIITISGRLTNDPELRSTRQNTPVTNFTIACERDFGDKQTDFIDCIAWKGTAEFVSKYFHKGQLAIVSGSLQSRKWEDRDGNKRVNWEINAEKVYFGEPKRAEKTETFYEDEGEGELPF